MSVILRIVTVVAVVVAAVVCISLGRWQLGRWEQKKQENRSLVERIAADALPVAQTTGAAPPAGKVEVRGRFDSAHHVVLGPRSHGGSPGVHVVTPFILENQGGVVLVDRGWLFSADAHTVFPEDHDEPDVRTLTGITSAIPRGLSGSPWTVREGDSTRVWSARALDLDSLAARLPFEVAAWQIQELPGDGVPLKPRRLAPEPANEMMHLSYAMQWFLFASIIIVGPLIVMRVRRQSGGPPRSAPEREVPIS